MRKMFSWALVELKNQICSQYNKQDFLCFTVIFNLKYKIQKNSVNTIFEWDFYM